MKSRQKESARIRAANRAVAVVRLMDGQLLNWEEFLQADISEIESLPRRALKAGNYDVKQRVSKDIQRFCQSNFLGMTQDTLNALYGDIKSYRGLEMPLGEFEEKYARVRPEAMQGNPSHSTVHISLWGLRFEFPEKYITDDITYALNRALDADTYLEKFRKKSHRELIGRQADISQLLQTQKCCARMALMSCFNLVEAYFNGLAWEYLHDQKNALSLSNRRLTLLRDTAGTALGEKILKYPEIISGTNVFDKDKDPFFSFVQIVKPYRDSLVHPSPFSAPERFGGYDKLRNLYRIDTDTAVLAASLTMNLISEMHRHLTDGNEQYPPWLMNLVNTLDNLGRPA